MIESDTVSLFVPDDEESLFMLNYDDNLIICYSFVRSVYD